MPADIKQSVLKAYEVYTPTNTSLVEEIFGVVLILIVGLFLGFGYWARTVRALPEPIEKKIQEIKTRFVIEEKKKQAVKPAVKKKAPGKVEDLTQKPLLNQKEDNIVQEPQPANAAVVRRVYGLRRVFSVGIGAQGGMGDAVIGKLGNTLNKEVDTVTATREDIKGKIVSITTVTTAPKMLTIVKPEYTREMIEAKVEGVVKAELLVDIDGKVKEVKLLNDLGYGSAERAREAFLQWTFEPAKRDGSPVTVWITYSIRFVLLQ